MNSERYNTKNFKVFITQVFTGESVTYYSISACALKEVHIKFRSLTLINGLKYEADAINPEDMLWVFQLSVSQLEIMLRQQRVQTHKCLCVCAEAPQDSESACRLGPD